MDNPKVSVIMPSYNKEKYIAAAIESVLNQTFKNFELIIIDDMSNDRSVEIIQMYPDKRIRFFQNDENIGISQNRNRALDLAKGEYIALLDADDISTNIRFEKEVEYLDNHPDIDVVFGEFLEIDEEDNIKETYFVPMKNPAYIKARLMVQDIIPNGSCMYRKNFVDQHNIRYRDGYLGMDDYLFWVECSLYGSITGLSELFLYWRNTKNNGTNTYKYSAEYQAKRYEKYSEILIFALRRNGFILTEAEENLYCKVLSEYSYKIATRKELEEFLRIIKKICVQSEEMSNSKEIKHMYRKQFGISLQNSYIWD